MRTLAVALTTVLLCASGCKERDAVPGALRVGFFPNVTHAQALVGAHEGVFVRALAPTPVEFSRFSAGPAAMEALLAGAVDVAYVGSGPAIIAHVRSEGRIRVISGSANGGALLVVRTARKPSHLHGKLVAAPQIGNTQDIALRRWMRGHHLVPDDRGGDVRVTAVSNPEIVNLFRRGELEGAWVPEPWASRLLIEGGHVLVDERDLWPEGRFATTVIVVTEDALRTRRGDVERFLRAHVELTRRANADRAGFLGATHDAFEAFAGKRLPDGVIESAFGRIELTTDPMRSALEQAAEHAQELGYVPEADMSRLVEPSLLEPGNARASP